MPISIVLSHYQIKPLLQARDAGSAVTTVSPDLGLSTVEVQLEDAGIRFHDGNVLAWNKVAEINEDENTCYLFEEGNVYTIQLFSEEYNLFYSLYPTEGAPTMLISGTPMHRIKGTDPYEDTLEKIRAARPAGNVLDTTTGLGYTAIEAAKRADHVTTIELDETALTIARENPWSRDLFDNPKITQIVGDSFEEIQRFEDGAFTRIIHDPPAFSLAGHLYGGEFYAQCHRVLSRSGRMFHYVGDPESRSGRNITGGVVRRLKEAGFRRIERKPRAFGVVAYK